MRLLALRPVVLASGTGPFDKFRTIFGIPSQILTYPKSGRSSLEHAKRCFGKRLTVDAGGTCETSETASIFAGEDHSNINCTHFVFPATFLKSRTQGSIDNLEDAVGEKVGEPMSLWKHFSQLNWTSFQWIPSKRGPLRAL